jgi:Bacterial Ig domain/Bacterial cadherin-like domain/Fibronectin type III domain
LTRSLRLPAVLLASLLILLLLPTTVAAAVPDPGDDTVSVAEDSGANALDVLGNDTSDAGALAVTGKTNGAHGTVTFSASDVSYAPASNYNGTDTFTYTVTNDDGPATATVHVTVTPVDDAPVAHGETLVWWEDAPYLQVDVALLANDTDVDDSHGSLTMEVVSQPAHGTLTPLSGHWTYQTDPDWNQGQFATLDTFQYRVSDGHEVSGTVTGSMWIALVNDPPSFTPGGDVMVAEDSGPATFPGWASDFDPGPPDEDTTQTIHFTIALGASESSLFSAQPAVAAHRTANQGRLTFTPAANAEGVAHVTVTPVDDGGSVTDGGVTYGDPSGDPQTFTITITSENDDPVADDDSLTVAEDGPATNPNVLIGDTDPDGDALSITAVTQGAKGTVTITGGGAGLTYQPAANANGSDAFTYTVEDGEGGSDVGTVHVTITPQNDPPQADDDSATILEDALASPIDVLGNDSDIDGDTLTVSGVTQGAHGTVVITGGGSGVAYTPTPDLHGLDTFTYTVSDGHGMTDAATVSVTIDPVNDPPVAADDSATMAEDAGAAPIGVLDNDSDVDGDDLEIVARTDGAHGTVAITGGGSGLTYRPADDFHGSDTFTYTVSDGTATRTATVTVTVTSVNDDPAADDDECGVDEDAPTSVRCFVLAGDTDIDGDTLTVSGVTQGAKGVVAIVNGGTAVTYRPFSNLSGPDTFTYTVSDGHGGADTATVTMTIGGLNDPPDAVNDLGFHVAEGAGATPLDVLANDDDPDDNDLTITSRTNGQHGTVTITGNGTGLTYQPAKLFSGTDRFTYVVDDGHGGMDGATVLVTVDKDMTSPVVSAPMQRLPGQTVDPSSTRTRISWSATDPGSGVAKYVVQVSVNGGAFSAVALPKATTTTIDRILAAGKTYRFRVQATDKHGNKSSYVYGPTFRVGRYQESSVAVAYTGSWGSHKTSSALGGAVRYSGSAGRVATFHPTAYDVGIVVTRTTSSGRAEIWVDGILITTVNLDRASAAYRQLVFSRHFATLASHTIEIKPLGDGRVDLDAFILLR